MNNLPDKSVVEPIGMCTVKDGTIQIYNNDGYRITAIHYNPDYLDGLARSIATEIIAARNIGYKQCQQDFRNLIGVKGV